MQVFIDSSLINLEEIVWEGFRFAQPLSEGVQSESKPLWLAAGS